MSYVPCEIFLTKGKGVHKDKLQSFEAALRDAGIAEYNLVKVSSIFPPHSRVIPKEKGLEKLISGQIVHLVMSENSTSEPHRQLCASIGLARPKDSRAHGYISEHHAFGQTEKEAGDYAEDLAASMLASTLGIEFDTDLAYDTRKDIYKMSGKIVRSQSVTQSTIGHKKGMWTTVIAAAVLIPPEDDFIKFLKQKYREEYESYLKTKSLFSQESQ
jgi:arginine decarboxylase